MVLSGPDGSLPVGRAGEAMSSDADTANNVPPCGSEGWGGTPVAWASLPGRGGYLRNGGRGREHELLRAEGEGLTRRTDLVSKPLC